MGWTGVLLPLTACDRGFEAQGACRHVPEDGRRSRRSEGAIAVAEVDRGVKIAKFALLRDKHAGGKLALMWICYRTAVHLLWLPSAPCC